MNVIAIIGAGASGLTAAIEAARGKVGKVVLLERATRVGRKLLATGNGRCNLSNLDLSASHYHGTDPSFCQVALSHFGLDNTRAFFERIGVPWRAQEQKLYPYSLQAGAVVDALRFEAEHLGVELLAEHQVTAIHVTRKGHFLLSVEAHPAYPANAVIVSCGGAASPDLGGTHSGYELLTALGHTQTALDASVVQLKASDPSQVKALSGIKAEVTASLLSAQHTVKTHHDEVLFTDYGLSGPAVFQLSGYCARLLRDHAPDIRIGLDFFPDLSCDALYTQLLLRQKQLSHTTLERFFIGLLPTRIGYALLKATHLTPLSQTVAALTENELSALAVLMKNWQIPITATMGLKHAQVTIGGIATCEFDAQTLMSHHVPGIFACGEVLDIDGDCGGYNLQWAWSSGRAAAQGACHWLAQKEN